MSFFLRVLSFKPNLDLEKKEKEKPQTHLFEVGRVPGLVHGPDAVELVHGLVHERDLRMFREGAKE